MLVDLHVPRSHREYHQDPLPDTVEVVIMKRCL
jgi:hypothetical protein